MKRIALLAVVAGLMAPSAAMAQSSTCQAYNPQLCSSVSGVAAATSSTSGTTASTTSSEGTLPFTGLDVVLLVAGGGALLGAGFVVRRLSKRLG